MESEPASTARISLPTVSRSREPQFDVGLRFGHPGLLRFVAFRVSGYSGAIAKASEIAIHL